MKTFKQFINEEAVKEDIVDFLRKNCKQACEDMATANNLMWRGMRAKHNTVFSIEDSELEVFGNIITPRQDREPLNTPSWLHKVVDDYFEEEFGKRLRSTSVFGVGEQLAGISYGPRHVIFPIGEYDIYWSPLVSDLTMRLFPSYVDEDELGPVGGIKHWVNEKIPLANVTRKQEAELAIELLQDAGYRKGPNVEAIASEKELMLQCSRYLAIPVRPASQISVSLIEQWIGEVAA